MVIKPLYLLADSQLFFWKSDSDSLAERIRADLDSANPKAAYIGASNGDQPSSTVCLRPQWSPWESPIAV